MSQSSQLKPVVDALRDHPDELIKIILHQADAIEQLQKEVAELKQQIKDSNDRNDGLSAKVEELEKKAARQAAPFRIEDKDRTAQPKKPGRPKGHPGSCRAIVAAALGAEFAGVLVSDCLATYDDVNPRQQKCYSHHLKAIKQAGEGQPSAWLDAVRGLLLAAMALKHPPLAPEQKARCRAELEVQAQTLLSLPRPTNLEEKVRRRLEKQRDHLFTFLDVEEVATTNNLAERQLRPAVIARKVSCGNKTPKGAHVWEILASLAATCTQRSEPFAQLVSQAALLSYAR